MWFARRRGLWQRSAPTSVALCVSFTPRTHEGSGARPPIVRPEGIRAALGISRTLSRIVRGAARAGPAYLRVFDACYGYLVKYDLPMSKAPEASAPEGGRSSVPAYSPQPRKSAYAGTSSREGEGQPRQKESSDRGRSRSPGRRGAGSFEDTRHGRMAAWLAGKDPKEL